MWRTSFRLHMTLSLWHLSDVFNCHLTPESSSPFPPYSNVNSSMGDPDMRSSTKSFDEKHSFEDFQVVAPTTWTTSAANVTRFLSEKLLAWGVEERGAYHISTSEPGRP